MSPRPMSVCAPPWSMIVIESIAEATLSAMRAGKLALILPVMTLTSGRCVAMMRWMPTARASWARRTTRGSTSAPASIMRSLISSMTIAM